jgi:hypothetical protein
MTTYDVIDLARDLPEEQVTIGEIRVLAAATPNLAQ